MGVVNVGRSWGWIYGGHIGGGMLAIMCCADFVVVLGVVDEVPGWWTGCYLHLWLWCRGGSYSSRCMNPWFWIRDR